jgi:class 3 adenylate cyclase
MVASALTWAFGKLGRRYPRVFMAVELRTAYPVILAGAGRLNVSVIGDAVNVAARVEAMTREVDQDVLVTAAAAKAISSEPAGGIRSRDGDGG